MRDKRMTLDEVVGELRSGMTIGIGGWGSRRKPMALVRALLRSEVTDLTVVAYGGPDLGLLCSAGKVRKAYYGFVSLDSAPFYDPWFAKARTDGAIVAREMDEGMVKCGLQAAAARLPFLPIRAGLGSDVPNFWDGELRTVESPYPDAEGRVETLIAMPALTLDAAFVHLDLGDRHGNAAYTGVDPYMDDLFCLAAERRYLSVDRLVDTDELVKAVPQQAIILNRMMVDGVVEVPGGAHFTFSGSYGRDEKFQRYYVEAAADPEAWAAFEARYLNVSEDDYQAAVREFAAQHSEDRR
ncbi:CoA transferase subunit A [Nocardia transvalensis]|uniref:CoA transferase subunit A n=1 Tax=Nocardia transvalensis TaxID=37333 RepID=UPI001892F064|nr:CoA transferase subunit A [Nocardia transvalensis]MBF6332697.1 CoA transferase subunit A [Nocardia transvalensis]